MTYKKWMGWIAVFVWIGLIFYLTSQPATDSRHLSKGISSIIISLLQRTGLITTFNVNILNSFLRKAAHFFNFMLLGALFVSALSLNKVRSIKTNMALAFACSVMFAIIDETLQHFVPGRRAMVGDVILDSAGALLGIGLWWLFWGKRRKRHAE